MASRAGLSNLLGSIKELHNIGSVSTSIDWSEDVKQEAVKSMKRPVVGFLSLPSSAPEDLWMR